MTELRDAGLRKAMDAAPDAALRPPAATREAIRAAAHAAAQPAWRRWFGRAGAGWFGRAGAGWFGRAGAGAGTPWVAAFASLLVATLVVVVWQGREVPGPRPELPLADRPAPRAEAPQAPAGQDAQAIRGWTAGQEPPAAPAKLSPSGASAAVAPGAERGEAEREAAAAAASRERAEREREERETVQRGATERREAWPDASPVGAAEPRGAPAAPVASVAPVAPVAPPATLPPAPAEPAPVPAPATPPAPARAPAPMPMPAPAAPAATQAQVQQPPAPASRPAAAARWDALRISADVLSARIERRDAMALAPLLEQLLHAPAQPQAMPAGGSLRIELLQGGQASGVLESGDAGWTWLPRGGAPVVLAADAVLAAQAREQALRLLRR